MVCRGRGVWNLRFTSWNLLGTILKLVFFTTLNLNIMPKYAIKFPKVASIGHRVSHAKNRTKHAFKRNLHRATILVDGQKQKVLVPTKMLRMLKKQGLTTHWQPETKSEQLV